MGRFDNVDKDLVNFLKTNIDYMVENHIENWGVRYENKDLELIRYDLYVNHDISLEIEFVTEGLERELEDDEYGIIEDYFNESVLNKFK